MMLSKKNLGKYSAINLPFFLNLLVVLSLLTVFHAPVHAADEVENPDRRQFTSKYGLIHHWQLKAWKDNTVLCDIYIDYAGVPLSDDIGKYCGSTVLDEYLSAPACTSFLESGNSSTCIGSFLTYLGEYKQAYSEVTLLPVPRVTYRFTRCDPGAWCKKIPEVEFSGIEPLEGYEITGVHILVGGEDFSCLEKDICEYQIPVTPVNGVTIEFWASSSFGDETEHQTLHLRTIFRKENDTEYMLEVLTPGTSDDTAALTWDIFPTPNNENASLYALVNHTSDLTTDNQLYYLAGKLIFAGEVNAEGCSNSGLLSNGNADACGEERAHDATVAWQNRYDSLIYQAGVDYGLPAKIIKGVITQESQFWSDTGIVYEYGIGCLSEKGIDVLMNWDTTFYLQKCLSMYTEETCATGYANLTADQRAYLRGLTLRAVGTDEEISLIARVLRADTEQTAQVLTQTTGKSLSAIATYEDMWDFTMATFHAGSGCITEGVKELVESEQEITFANFCVVNHDCPTACTFVERIKDYNQ